MLSKSVEYALKSLILIKDRFDKTQTCIGVIEINTTLDIPKHFTAKILQTLVKQEYIKSTKGPGGGFTPDNYSKTLRELIISIDGSFKFDKCVLGLENCSDSTPCPLHTEYKILKKDLICSMFDKSILDICNSPNKILK
jgi:Rrf2 family protein